MNDIDHVVDTKEAYELIIESCIADLEKAYDQNGKMTTHLSITCDDASITDIEVGYEYSLGIDYDCDTNTYAIISASVRISDIEVATFDFDDCEITTKFTNLLKAINKRQLALDLTKRMESYCT